MIPLVLAFHTMAAVIWVGGLFFAHVALRPSLPSLPPEYRMPLLRAVLGRFFRWVWASIAVLLVSGYGVVLFGYEGFAAIGLHIRIMQVTGLIMTGLFVLAWTGPWHEFCHALDRHDSPAAERQLSRIRLLMTVNLPLGLFTAAIGATGGFWTY